MAKRVKIALLSVVMLFSLGTLYAQDTITVVAVGDIQYGSIFPDRSWLPNDTTAANFLSNVKPYFSGADILFCNMEGVFADSLVPECKKFCFGMPSSYVKYYKDAGFNLISVGNNHSNDFRVYGRENTTKILNDNKIHWAGYQTKPYEIFVRKGVRYGFCAFSPNTAIMNLNDYKTMQAIVQKLDSICDIVIVSFHGGGEGPSYQHVTRKKDYYIEQDRGNVYEFAHLAIDAGADVVLGHGPHVTRGVEVYKSKFIAYSMGNFATYSQINIGGKLGIAPIIRIKIDATTGDFIEARIIPTKKSKPNTGPYYDEDKEAIKIIKELSKADFYDNPPSISNDGIITKPRVSSPVVSGQTNK